MNIGWTDDFPADRRSTTSGVTTAGVYANRAFIQLAGFTWGVATSYYDFFSSPATSYTVPWSSDTGDGGWKVAAYTAQLGNGVSATLSVEEPRRAAVVNASQAGTFSHRRSPFAALAPVSASRFGCGRHYADGREKSNSRISSVTSGSIRPGVARR